jgi:hypothetical protein
MKKFTIVLLIGSLYIFQPAFAKKFPFNSSIKATIPCQFNQHQKPYKYSLFYITANGRLALLGKYPIGTNVTILNHKTGTSLICKTVSVKTYTSDYEGTTTATTLNQVIYARYEEIILYTAIFSARMNTFQLIKGTAIKDSIQIHRLDSTLKAGSYLTKLLAQYDEAKFANDLLTTLTDKLPLVEHVNIPGIDLKIITYKLGQYEAGPRFVEINNKLFPLSGQCSSLDYQVYKYGNTYYIKSNSGACETGYIIADIFSIRNGSIVNEYSNGGYSN